MVKNIEKDFPIGELSRLAERESWRKEIYRPVYYIHKWWARRLGSVFRAITLSACLNELNEDEHFFDYYYRHQSFAEVTVFDPFMGSGVTVGEAAKLGCKVIGRDINPVASIIVQASLNHYNLREVESYFREIELKAKAYISQYYQTRLSSGELADVLYFFLVKVARCPACDRKIRLFKSQIFSKHAIVRKDPGARAICPSCLAINHIRYDDTSAQCISCNHIFNPQDGNVRGAIASCPHCQTKFKLVDYLKTINGPLQHEIYAKLILRANGVKTYEPVNAYDLALHKQAEKEFSQIAAQLRQVHIVEGYNTNQVLRYNYTSWDQMFTARQHLCIKKISDAIKEIDKPEYKRLFACLLSGTLEFNNVFCSFKGEGTGAVRHMFAHHILKPELMPLEANIWGTVKSSGSFSTLYAARIRRALAYKMSPFELKVTNGKSSKVHNISPPLSYPIAENYAMFKSGNRSVYISQGDSSATDIPNGAVDYVITDPPFFDNVHYSQLADFFFYWLNDILALSKVETTRQLSEVQDTDSSLYTQKLSSVFTECNRVLKDDGLLIFTYHHARHEGWTSVYKAIRRAGFICTQSYPIKAEMSVSVPIQQAKIPIHLDLILVCRKAVGETNVLQREEIIDNALSVTKEQIHDLLASNIDVSLGDAKGAMMGRLLCELSHLKNFQVEIDFLNSLEEEIDTFLNELLQDKKDSVYKTNEQPQQLALFEEIGQYLVGRTSQNSSG